MSAPRPRETDTPRLSASPPGALSDSLQGARPSRVPFRWELVALLWFAFFLNQGDRQIFGVTLPLLRAEFHLTSAQTGLVATLFSIVFGLTVPIAGWLGDRVRRELVVVSSLAVFSVGTLLTGIASAFPLLLLFRGLATGVGEALYAPAANTLIAEHHARTRARALSLHQTANYTGVVFGSLIAGLLADRFGWRVAFVGFGAAGLLWTAVIWLRTRGRAAPVEWRAPRRLRLVQAAAVLVKSPQLLAQTVGFSGLVFVLVGYLTWTPDLLRERFHLSLAEAGLQAVAWHHGVGYVGLLVGGALSDRLQRLWPRARLTLMGAAMMLCAPFLFICARANDVAVIYVALGGFGFFRGLYDANLYAGIFDFVDDELRASVTGLIVAAAYIVGAISPAAMGALKDQGGLQSGFYLLTGTALVAGLVVLTVGAAVAPPRAPEVA